MRLNFSVLWNYLDGKGHADSQVTTSTESLHYVWGGAQARHLINTLSVVDNAETLRNTAQTKPT